MRADVLRGEPGEQIDAQARPGKKDAKGFKVRSRRRQHCAPRNADGQHACRSRRRPRQPARRRPLNAEHWTTRLPVSAVKQWPTMPGPSAWRMRGASTAPRAVKPEISRASALDRVVGCTGTPRVISLQPSCCTTASSSMRMPRRPSGTPGAGRTCCRVRWSAPCLCAGCGWAVYDFHPDSGSRRSLVWPTSDGST